MFRLSDDERAISDTARDFAAEYLAPGAIEWDQNKHFPVDVLRKAGALGMGGIYIREDVDGSGLTGSTASGSSSSSRRAARRSPPTYRSTTWSRG